MKIIETKQQIITKQHAKWKYINQMCLAAKNLYNYANFIIRDNFIKNGNCIPYSQLNSQLRSHELYKACMSQPANCVLRRLDKAWKSFFVAIKDWKKNPKKYKGMPKLPKYCNKNGRYVWEIPNNSTRLFLPRDISIPLLPFKKVCEDFRDKRRGPKQHNSGCCCIFNGLEEMKRKQLSTWSGTISRDLATHDRDWQTAILPSLHVQRAGSSA